MRAPPLAALALALAACSGQPDYYLLPQVAPTARQASPVGGVVVADLGLPAYVSALEIASLTDSAIAGNGPPAIDSTADSSWSASAATAALLPLEQPLA